MEATEVLLDRLYCLQRQVAELIGHVQCVVDMHGATDDCLGFVQNCGEESLDTTRDRQ